MRMFPCYCDEKYRVAVKCGNKKKSKNFYYKLVGYSGVEFIKKAKYAHSCPSKEEAEFLIRYLQKRIKEVGFVLKGF
jgi:hypothetical protein